MDTQTSVSSAQETPTPSAHPSVPRKRHLWIRVLVLAAVALLFVLVVHHRTRATVAQASSRGTAGPVPVTTATAKVGDLRIYLNAIGTVTPVYTDTITAQVTGVITAVHYREGQSVRKGAPLIELDSRPYAAQLEQAWGTLERDQQLLAQAQMDLERYQQAWARNGIPSQTLEDQEKLVLQDKGTVRYDEGVVRYDEVQLGYCHITSPIGGRVGLRLVDPGNLVTANGTTSLAVNRPNPAHHRGPHLAEDHLMKYSASCATAPSSRSRLGIAKITHGLLRDNWSQSITRSIRPPEP